MKLHILIWSGTVCSLQPFAHYEEIIIFFFSLFFVQPPQYKLDPRLARLLGVHTQTRPVIINALWQYIKAHKLQDQHEREYINNDAYFQQVIPHSQIKLFEDLKKKKKKKKKIYFENRIGKLYGLMNVYETK